MEALALGLGLHLLAARHDHEAHALGRVPALEGGGGLAQVADPGVGAAADEDDLHRLAGDRLAGLQAHVLERPLERPARGRVGGVLGPRHAPADRDAHAGVRAPGDHRLEGVRVERDRGVEGRAVVGGERPPPGDRGVPRRALRGMAAAVDVLEGRVVGGDEAGPRAALDGHVADRHPLLHRERPDRLAAVLEDVAGAAADPDPGDEGEDDVLGPDAGAQPAVDADLVGLRLPLEERLGGEDHLDLARADPEGQRPERAVGRRVAVAADDRHARLGQAQLRADDVDDPLGLRAVGVDRDPELGAVGLQLLHLGGGHRVDDREAARRGRRGVVGGRDRALGAADAEPAGAQAREGLRAGDLVDEVEVDGEDGGRALVLGDDVVVPDLLDERAGARVRAPRGGDRTRCCGSGWVRSVGGRSVAEGGVRTPRGGIGHGAAAPDRCGRWRAR